MRVAHDDAVARGEDSLGPRRRADDGPRRVRLRRRTDLDGALGDGRLAHRRSLRRGVARRRKHVGRERLSAVGSTKIPNFDEWSEDLVDLENAEACAHSRYQRCRYSRERAL